MNKQSNANLNKYTVYDACNSIIKVSKNHIMPADELLSKKINHILPIPFKSRNDFEQISEIDKQEGLYTGNLAPQIDLKVLHYFLTQLCIQRYPHLINCFDETSLITLGLLVDQWIEEYFYSMDSEESATELDSDSEGTENTSESYDDGSESEDATALTNNTETSKPIIGKGPAQSFVKFVNYRDFPADI
ncbi:hypothetical protein RI543_001510 [Arxiozyma heterogenica]|uniref:RNA polymerase I-specific transcription initiation factor RRN10 n=1 Tax=Arxiozyma heterogenica TaxID=278026 RepID=A0AAN7WLX9_9SACH|nr:hypothetical protein RI543_001510 [Kazachstania heterogenica]